jgi:hypothetical protein
VILLVRIIITWVGFRTSSRLAVIRKSLCWLSPAPVQKYPIFLGLILEPTKGGLANGGVGTCKIGSGGAFEAKGTVTPGITGIRGGRLIPRGLLFRESERSLAFKGPAAPCCTKMPARATSESGECIAKRMSPIIKEYDFKN